LKIQKSEQKLADNVNYRNNRYSCPSFKSGFSDALLTGIGNTTQRIQGGGFLVSFLIQDGLGMTLPRVGAAFLRDKDVTGTYNIQEGFEVLGREGLTGPCMMAVAPIMFALAAKFGKSTGVNSRLIRRFGNEFKNFVRSSVSQKTTDIMKDTEKFKQLFYKENVEKMLKNTLGEKTLNQEELKNSTDYILEQIRKYENVPDSSKLKELKLSKKKYKYARLCDIEKHIDNLKYSTSNDLNLLNKVIVGSAENADMKSFATIEAIESMVKYTDDVVKTTKNLDIIDENVAESIKNKSIAKRFTATISTLAATLGVLSVLPKLYLKSDISPAERVAIKMRENDKQSVQAETIKGEKEVSFKGKSPNSSWFSKFGKFISGLQSKNEALSNELEYKGHNFTNTLMASLSLLGLLLPRGLRALNRAPIDENGKKDKSELYEILLRDTTSSLAVVFAVPILTKLFVSSYEKKTGFVLMKRDRDKSMGKKLVELINPYSEATVLSNKKLEIIYNANSQEKMLNFCDYINKNKGDLGKILAKSDNLELLKNKGLNIQELNNLTRTQKNAKIKDFFKNLEKSTETDKMIESLFVNNSAKQKNALTKFIEKIFGKSSNKILSHAKGLNSIPTMLAMCFISPYILGWVIPRLTYANTRRMQEKKNQEQISKIA